MIGAPPPIPRRTILIEGDPEPVRIALLEDDGLRELFLDPQEPELAQGDIYKGKVTRVLPGMQSAFVDIGDHKDAFLYVADVADDLVEGAELFAVEDLPPRARRSAPRTSIGDLVRTGQEILVQVVKLPSGSKGARVSSLITLPGRHLVLTPTSQHIGVSRKIVDPLERERLRRILAECATGAAGAIVRTSAVGRGRAELCADLQALAGQWEAMRARAERIRPPALIHRDLELPLRVLRDLTGDDATVVVAGAEVHQRCLDYLESLRSPLAGRLQLHQGSATLFDRFGIEDELARALRPRVWLKHGGYLVIQPTEALVVVDVNTGKYVGDRDLESTVFQTNLEAVKELARQLVLRDLGGIIVVDLIDMEDEDHRQAVLATLAGELRRDRAHTRTLGINEFGLLHLTRQRLKRSLHRILGETCGACGGRGWTLSPRAVVSAIRGEILRRHRDGAAGGPAGLQLHVHPQVAEVLRGPERALLQRLEQRLGLSLRVHADPARQLEDFELVE